MRIILNKISFLWSLIGLVVLSVLVLQPAADSCSSSLPISREDNRDSRLQPERVMDAIGVRPGMVIGEPGAGRGYFTFKLSKRVGDSGKVYANDIKKEALEYIERRSRKEGIGNIVTILGEVADPLFPDGEMDMVVMVYALHDFEKPVEFLRNLKHDLKPGATVAIIDQDAEKTGSKHFLTRAAYKRIFEQAGYEFVREENFLKRDLVLVFHPTDRIPDADSSGPADQSRLMQRHQLCEPVILRPA